MFFRKLPYAASMADTHRYSFKYNKEGQNTSPSYVKYSLCSFFFLSIWFVFLICWFPRSNILDDRKKLLVCDGSVSVYVYELPAKFNRGLLRDCRHLNVYTDMCPHVCNRGLGQPLEHIGPSWFATHQFIAEMIFHARVENHPCRTWEPENATLFYVPFYGGLHASSQFREPDLEIRDGLAVELAKYVSEQKWWQRKNGGDHFLALGRTAWDFMRTTENGGPDFGANALLNLPQVKNMSVLTVERHPWKGTNQYGIPYASYFHPSTWEEMELWQEKMRRSDRPYLFSFVGGARTGVEKAAVRDEILRQCEESRGQCYLLKCGGSGGGSKCHDPGEVLKVMSQSQFCMQAPGDSFTRRSTFDSMLGGCIPVFFSEHTAYSQYGWYLPKERSEYSVFLGKEEKAISERSISIEEELLKIPPEEVERMRRTVIDLIPRITYMHPNATAHDRVTRGGGLFKDAVDVALEELSSLVSSSKLVSTASYN